MKNLIIGLLLAGCGLLATGCGHVAIAGERGSGPYSTRGHRDGGAVVVHHGDRAPFVPPGHMPPPGHARIWHHDRPPGHQPPPFRVR